MKKGIEALDVNDLVVLYEKPNLKRYGSMKHITLDANGSAGDGMGRSGNDRNFARDDRSGNVLTDDLIEDDNFFATDIVVDNTRLGDPGFSEANDT